MSQKIIIANWKMKLNPKEGLDLAKDIAKASSKWSKDLEILLCPSYEVIDGVINKVKKTQVKVGSQDCHWEDKGSFTGEVSPKVLKDMGCSYTIIGHSERRAMGETNQQINRKVAAALRNDLMPIVCVGETFEERQEGQKDFIIMKQVSRALEEIKLLPEDQLILAYEPVWVIGSGQAVEPVEAEHTHRVIRQVLIDHFGLEVVQTKIRIIYGGSVDAGNIKGFMEQPTVDGVLVGGASLQADSFIELVNQISE